MTWGLDHCVRSPFERERRPYASQPVKGEVSTGAKHGDEFPDADS